jgi:predicted transcriptional regulator of viral defense system
MIQAKLPYNYLETYLTSVQAKGRLTFSLEEIKAAFDISDKSIEQSIYRLKTKKQVAQLRKGFYAIIPPQYSKQGMLPAHLFIDDLMQYLHRRYYVALLSAAALHGAAHQQPMEYFVVTEKPALRNIHTSKLKLNFFVKKEWQDAYIESIKTDSGYIKVSSPELTALDLLYYIEHIGINRAVTVIKELKETIKPTRLSRLAKVYPQTAAIQRLGYILEQLNDPQLAAALWNVIKEKVFFAVPLYPGNAKNKLTSTKWKIIENVHIEADL